MGLGGLIASQSMYGSTTYDQDRDEQGSSIPNSHDGDCCVCNGGGDTGNTGNGIGGFEQRDANSLDLRVSSSTKSSRLSQHAISIDRHDLCCGSSCTLSAVCIGTQIANL